MRYPIHFAHLDFKGLIPSENRLIQWLERLAQWGYGGVVLEYEDRLPWTSWPGTYRAGYPLEGWQRIWREARRLGLEIIPLVQMFGHLEWLLKHPQYAHLREADLYNLVCPLHPDTLPRLRQWLDEVIDLHPDSRFIHVGLDEVYHLAGCPKCAARGAQLAEGKLGVFLEHVEHICRHVLDRGRRPILWADMFLSGDRTDLAGRVPEEAIVCHWGYGGDHPCDGATKLLTTGRAVMGASAIRCSWSPQHSLMSELAPRMRNVRQWREFARGGGRGLLGILHTTWGRPNSLTQLYGPWEGWLPPFITGGRDDAQFGAALGQGMDLLEKGLAARDYRDILKCALAMEDLRSDDAIEQQTLRWWKLALRHQNELWWTQRAIGDQSLRAVGRHVGLDPLIVRLKEQEHADVLERLGQLEPDIRAFFNDNQLSDQEEYIGSRLDNLRRSMAVAWP